MISKGLLTTLILSLLPLIVAAEESALIVSKEDQQIIADLELMENLAMLEDMDIVENYDVLENGSDESWLGTDEEAE